jgi:outer membrane lipoprotein-sorting protein
LIEIRYKRLRLNKPVPEEVFQLSPPPGFEIIKLDNQEM